MTASEVIGFILPQADDPIQVSFLCIIVVMMVSTIFSAWKYANDSSWERKWNRGTPDETSDDLDIDHGSVTDLWHAVATAPEKIAEIMPGLLLVIGLLGTFLGLGLALNKASSILGQADAMSAGAAADSMDHLMGLLQGLGTKFKTSTWGITGFILLKIWSESMRYDEKRLAWVIGKVKIELEKRKQEEISAETQQRGELHAQIASTADKIVAGLAEHFGKLLLLEKGLHQQSIARLDAQREGMTDLKAEITATAEKLVNGQVQQVEQLRALESGMHQQTVQCLEAQHGVLTQMKEEMRATKESMQTFTLSTQSVVEQMASGANSIGEAAERMAQGADKVGLAGKELVGAIDEFKSQFTSVLDDVRKDLGKSIQDMSAQASNTLEKGSAQLSTATHEISAALGVLSQDVNKTMTEVKESIGKALDIQQRASNEFTLSAGNLNTNIAATTNIVGELADPIKEGLRAVSEAGQHMRSVGKSLDKSLQVMQDVVAKLEQLPSALHPVTQLPDHHQQMISALKPLEDLPVGQQLIIQEMQGLRTELKSTLTTAKADANQLVTVV